MFQPLDLSVYESLQAIDVDKHILCVHCHPHIYYELAKGRRSELEF